MCQLWGPNIDVSRECGPLAARLHRAFQLKYPMVEGEVVRGHACTRLFPPASAAARSSSGSATRAQRPLACAATVPHRVYVQRPRCGLCRFSHCHRIVILISFLGDSPLANDRRESKLKRIIATRHTETNAFLTKRAIRAVNESSA